MNGNKIHAIRLASIALLIAAGAPTHAQVEIDIIAVTGEFAHGGGGGQFKSFDRPVLNDSGDIAFRAALFQGLRGITEANDTGIWRKRPGTRVHKIARAGDYTSPFKPYGAQPEVNKARYGTLGDPQIGPDGRITFLTHLALPSEDSFIGAHNNEVIFTMKELSAGMLDVAQEKGSKAPMVKTDSRTGEQTILGDDGKRTWFDKLREPKVLPDGTIVFTSSLQMNGLDGKHGIWYYKKPDGEDPQIINPNFLFVENDRYGPISSGDGSAPLRISHLSSNSNLIAFRTREGIWRPYDGIASSNALSGTEIRNYGFLVWDELGIPKMSGNFPVFRATMTSPESQDPPVNREGIWVGTYAIALESEHAPGFPQDVVFDSLLDPDVDENRHIAFTANLRIGERGTPSHASVVYRNYAGDYRHSFKNAIVAKSSDLAPGSGGRRFLSFGAPMVNAAGQVAFAAELEPTDTDPISGGVWTTTASGALALVAMSGSPVTLPDGSSRNVDWVEATDIKENGNIALRIGFAEGTEAVAIASTTPPLPPDFESWAESKILNPEFRDSTDDPDGDGIHNLLEFALGGDPSTADSWRAPTLTIADSTLHDGRKVAEIAYTEPAVAVPYRYTFEKSFNLVNWSEVNDFEQSRILQPDGTYLVRTQGQTPIYADHVTKLFIRLKIDSED